MTTSAQENLLDWLRDAHAMEMQAEQMLTTTAKRLEHYPELKARIEEHITETKEQAKLVEQCLERLGADISTLKDVGGKMMALTQGLSGMFVTDEVVKASIASYVFEHMEIASYRALIAAAEMAGDTTTIQVCQQILPQEEAMAKWLEEHLPSTVQKFLTLDEKEGATAKR